MAKGMDKDMGKPDSARLTTVLTIGGEPVVNIITNSVQLDLFSPGRASFVVTCEHEPKGMWNYTLVIGSINCSLISWGLLNLNINHPVAGI